MSHTLYVMRAVRPHTRGWLVRSNALTADVDWSSLELALQHARREAGRLRRCGQPAVVLIERPNGWGRDEQPTDVVPGESGTG